MKKNVKVQMQMGALIAYISIGFSIVLGLIYTPWMIARIGKSDYGVYTIANSIISLFLFDFGLSGATSKFVASYRVNDNYIELRKFLSAIYQVYIIIDLVVFAIFLFVFVNIEVIYSNLSSIEIEKLKVVFVISGIYSIVSFPCTTFNGILTAYEKIIVLKATDLFYRIGTVIFTVIALMLNLGLYAVVVINALCGMVSILAKFIVVKNNVNIKINLKEKYTGIYKEVLDFSVWSTISGLSQRLIFNITPTLISMVAIVATDAVAIFGVISTIEGYFYIITTAINGMFIAKITRILQKENYRMQLTDLTIKVGKIQFFINGLLILGFVLIGKDFMVLWMGPDYIEAYYGVLLVEVPCLFFNPLQIANTTLIVQNKIKYQAFVNVVSGLCNVAVSFYLSRYWGAIGAAMSICIAYCIRLIMNLIVIKMKVNIDLKKYIKDCYIKMSLPILLSLIICCPIYFFGKTTWLNIICEGIIISVIYFSLAILLGTGKNEKRNLAIRIKSIFTLGHR